jgi:hypothetical protein
MAEPSMKKSITLFVEPNLAKLLRLIAEPKCAKLRTLRDELICTNDLRDSEEPQLAKESTERVSPNRA